MRLLETHSHTSERQGNETGKIRKQECQKGVALRGRKKSSTKNHRHVTRDGGGEKDAGKVNRKYTKKTRRKISRKMSRNTENPAFYSRNASFATNEWPDYPTLPRY